MNNPILLGAADVAGLLCPLHVWWSNRHGRQSVCCAPARKRTLADIDGRPRQAGLRAIVAEHRCTAASGEDVTVRAR